MHPADTHRWDSAEAMAHGTATPGGHLSLPRRYGWAPDRAPDSQPTTARCFLPAVPATACLCLRQSVPAVRLPHRKTTHTAAAMATHTAAAKATETAPARCRTLGPVSPHAA